MRTMQRYSCESMGNGGIVKLWLCHILYFIVTHPMDSEVILKTCLEKDDLHRFLRKLSGNGSIFAPVSIWRQRRKITVPVFSSKNVTGFVDVFSKQSEIMTKNLGHWTGKGQFSIWPYLTRYSLDSVGETTMGVKINSQSNPNAPYLTAITRLLNIICKRIFHLWLQPEWIFRLSSHYAQHEESKKVLYDFIDKVLKKKREELNNENKCEAEGVTRFDLKDFKNKTLLDLLISVSGGEKGFSDVELREEILVISVAGADTSAVCIGYTLQLLGKYPLIQEKVYEELREIFGDSERLLVKEDLPKLKYLERVMKESLRLFPPAPFVVRKISADTKLPSGRILPAGSGAWISIWAMHRDPKYWGSDAEVFDPDRFLPERLNLQNSCSYMPFSNGPRNCVGYQYAMMSIKTALAAILRRYRVVLEPEPTNVPHIKVRLDIMMKAVDDYEVALEKRKPQ